MSREEIGPNESFSFELREEPIETMIKNSVVSSIISFPNISSYRAPGQGRVLFDMDVADPVMSIYDGGGIEDSYPPVGV